MMKLLIASVPPLRQVTTALGIGSSHSLPTHLAIGGGFNHLYMEALNGGTMWNTSITVDIWIPSGYSPENQRWAKKKGSMLAHPC